ncbi:MAG: hypothetical protein U5L02_13120 [Rheinheimera sp.]|nr:hypothetical protein [Rheinheimera sp.]
MLRLLARTKLQIRHCVTLGVLIFISSAHAGNTCNTTQLQGSWELQAATYRDQSGKVVAEIKDQQTKSRKLIAGRHFSFITWSPDGKFSVAASGSFKADASGYHEQVDATSLARLQDKTYHFQCSISGDNWLHQGLEDGIQIEEHWLRVSGVNK